MGKHDDWFSEKGLANRAAGVKQIESKQKKLCMCVFWAICFVVWIIFGGLHIDRSANAISIDNDYNQFRREFDLFALGDASNGGLSFFAEKAYDACQIPRYEKDSSLSDAEYQKMIMEYFVECGVDAGCHKEGTGWTDIWTACGTILILQLLNFIALMIGTFWFPARLCGSICNCLCGCCCTFGMSIALMNVRFSNVGELCSYNVAPVNYKGDFKFDEGGPTYADDAALLAGMGVIQFLLACAQCTCCCIPLALTPKGQAKEEITDRGNDSSQAATPQYPQQQMYGGAPMGVPVQQQPNMLQPQMQPMLDQNGNQMYDANGQPVYQPMFYAQPQMQYGAPVGQLQADPMVHPKV